MMENIENRTMKLELEIPEAWYRKIQALCEIQDEKIETWLKQWIKEGTATETTNLNGCSVEFEMDRLEELEGRSSE